MSREKTQNCGDNPDPESLEPCRQILQAEIDEHDYWVKKAQSETREATDER